MSIRKLIGLAQFGFLDLTAGAFLVHILYLAFYDSQAPLGLLVLGAIVGVLPDSDLLLMLWRRQRLDLKHRNTFFHQPLLLAGIPSAWLFFMSPFWALVWLAPLLWHYGHDSIGQSMGIAWLYPIKQNKFAVFDLGLDGKRKLLVAHRPDYAGMTLDEALHKKFYRLTPTSVIEIILPFIFLVIIALT